jgi:cell division protein FtsB
VIPLLGFLVIGYFVWHGLHGAYGFWSAKQLDAEVAALSQQLAQLRGERKRLEQRVSLLRPESLDPDMLDERARALLNQAHPNDLVIMLKDR